MAESIRATRTIQGYLETIAGMRREEQLSPDGYTYLISLFCQVFYKTMEDKCANYLYGTLLPILPDLSKTTRDRNIITFHNIDR